MQKQIRGIILEGQSCSGKTSIINALKKLHSIQDNAERNTIFLSEHYSQNLNFINGELRQLSQTENLQVLMDRISMLENLNNYADSMGQYSRRSRGLFFVFERFHLNYALCFKDTTNNQYVELEKRLGMLNTQTILCVLSDNKIEQRLKHRASFTNTSLTDDYIREYKKNQAFLLSAAKSSYVPTEIICTDSMAWGEYAQLILDKIQ